MAARRTEEHGSKLETGLGPALAIGCEGTIKGLQCFFLL